MKLFYLVVFILSYFCSIMPQVMKITKTDGSAVEFKLSETDSITFSAIGKIIPVTSSYWNSSSSASSASYSESIEGVYEQTSEGLKIYGSGIETSSYIYPLLNENDFTGKSICLKWKAAASASAAVFITLYTSADYSSQLKIMNYGLSDSGDGWHYTRVILSNGTASFITSSGNYDFPGGDIEQTGSINITAAVYNFAVGITGGTESYVIIGEAGIE